jgi:hypothetical protein
MSLRWTWFRPNEPMFPGDIAKAEVHSMIINDWQSYPLNSLANYVVFNTEFDEGLENLVRKSFDLYELRLKDLVRTLGLGFAKNLKWPENEWTPAERLIDGKMIVQHIYSNLNSGHYSCTIPWKRDGTNLVNNINEVLARQRRKIFQII